jgi:Fe-S-cluster containining protein
MKVNCEGCAGCCVDWRPVSSAPSDHERRGPRRPLDDVYNLVPLTRDEVAAFVRDGFGDALVPRMWAAGEEKSDEDESGSDGGESDPGVEIDGVSVAAIGDRPAFFVGLRKSPKPVSPFGVDRTWMDACAFLDPETLQCRIHGGDLYPDECREYPGHNLALGKGTECERVEENFGGDRLLDREAPDVSGLLLGPQAVGSKVFAHPDPESLDGVVDRMRAGDLTDADRASFVGAAVGSRPGFVEVDEARAADAREAVLDADSWVGRATDEWEELAGAVGGDAADAPSGEAVEVARGAPETPGWDAVE